MTRELTDEDRERMNAHKHSVLELLRATISNANGVPISSVTVDPTVYEQIDKLEEEALEGMVESLREELEAQRKEKDKAERHNAMLSAISADADALCRECGYHFTVGPIGKCPKCDSRMIMASPKGALAQRGPDYDVAMWKRVNDGIAYMRKNNIWLGTAHELDEMVRCAPHSIRRTLALVTLNFIDWMLTSHVSEAHRDLMLHDLEASGRANVEAAKKN
jgi:predicted Zn-ribbon and HTH transcriptional regulator